MLASIVKLPLRPGIFACFFLSIVATTLLAAPRLRGLLPVPASGTVLQIAKQAISPASPAVPRTLMAAYGSTFKGPGKLR